MSTICIVIYVVESYLLTTIYKVICKERITFGEILIIKQYFTIIEFDSFSFLYFLEKEICCDNVISSLDSSTMSSKKWIY